MEQKAVYLRKNPIFSSLPGPLLAQAARVSSLKDYCDGETVFTKGDVSGSLYLVAEGSVHILQTMEGEEGAVIAELVSGDTFGELELLTSDTHKEKALCRGAAKLLLFPKEGLSLRDVWKEHPQLAAKLLFSFLRTLAGRIRKANTLVKENSQWVQEMRRRAYVDKPSGLYNKTYLEETLPKLLENKEKPSGLLLLKPDNFKHINDNYGHEAGDKTIQIMAKGLKNALRGEETALRYLGNELGIILPGADREALSRRARDFMLMFNGLDLGEATQNDGTRLSVSFGGAVYPDHGAAAEEIINAAHALPLLGRARGGNMLLFPEDLPREQERQP